MSGAARFRALVAVLGVSYAALWACAPVASGPPPAPMIEGRASELGGAFSFVQPLSDRAESVLGEGCAQGVVAGCGGPSLAGWYRVQRGRWDATTQVFVGVPTLAGATTRLAVRAVDRERVFVAPALQAGWLSAGVSVPVGIAASPHTWIVLTPAAQLSAASLVRGSAAVWHTGPKGAVVGVELGVGSAFSALPLTGDLSVLLGGQLPRRAPRRDAPSPTPAAGAPASEPR